MEQNHEPQASIGLDPTIQAPPTLLEGVQRRLHQRLEATQHVSPYDLLQALHAPQWETRAAALHALAKTNDQSHLDALTRCLGDEHRLVRAAAVRALSRFGPEVPWDQLLPTMRDEAWEVRELIVQVLGEQVEFDATSLLQSALQDSSSQVREAADYALKLHATKQQRPLLVQSFLHFQALYQANLLHTWLVLQRQVTLIHKSVWLLALIGCIVLFLACLLSGTSTTAWLLVASTITASAVGTAWICSAESDQGLEITLSTPTSLRLLLCCRLLLVLGYNIGVALLASALLTLTFGNFWELVQLWFAPLCFLSSLSLLLSVLLGSNLASWIVLGIEVTQTVHINVEGQLPVVVFDNFQHSVWQHQPVIFLLVPLCLLLALLYAPRQTYFYKR